MNNLFQKNYNLWQVREKLTKCKCPGKCKWCVDENPHSKQNRDWEKCKKTPWPPTLTLAEWQKKLREAPRICDNPNELLYWSVKADKEGLTQI